MLYMSYIAYERKQKTDGLCCNGTFIQRRVSMCASCIGKSEIKNNFFSSYLCLFVFWKISSVSLNKKFSRLEFVIITRHTAHKQGATDRIMKRY